MLEALTLVVLVALPAVLARLTGVLPIGSDVGEMFLPLWTWWGNEPATASGWNPWIFGGYPSDADPQMAHGHPLALLYGWLEPTLAATVEATVVPCLGALGLWFYLRAIGCDRVGRLLGGMTLGLGGVLVGHAPHPTIVRAIAAVPWGLLAIERTHRTRLAAALAGVTAMVIMAGHPQTSAICVAFLLAYGLVWSRQRGWMVGGMILGGVWGATVWLPMLRLVAHSTRSVFTPPFPNPTFLPAQWSRFILPFALGGGHGLLAGPPAEAFGCGLVECSVYPGIVGAFVVLAGLPLLLRNARGRFWVAAALASLIAAGGLVPLPAGVRGPARFLAVWAVAISSCVGLAAGAVRRRSAPSRAARISPWVALVILGLCLLWILWQSSPPPIASAGLAAALVAAAAASWHLARTRPGMAGSILVVLTAADLVAFAMTASTTGIRRDAYVRLRSPVAAARRVAGTPSSGAPDRVLLLPHAYSADWAAPMSVASVQGYSPLVPRSLPELLGEHMKIGLDAVGAVDDPSLARPRSHALDLLRVRWILYDPRDENALGREIASRIGSDSRWALVADGPPGWMVFENRRALPLAWLVYDEQRVPERQAVATVRGEAGSAPFDPLREALVTSGPRPVAQSAPDVASRRASSVAVVTYERDGDLELRVETGGPAILVTSELLFPGWQVLVDGQEQDLLAVDGGLRGVRVPAGASTVQFRYRPRDTRFAGWLYGAAFVATIALAVWPPGPSASSAGTRRRQSRLGSHAPQSVSASQS